MGSGENVLMEVAQRAPSVSSKVTVVELKFKRRWKDLVELYRIRFCWPYFLTCDVTGRSNKVNMYWFTVANCLSRKINLPNKMELSKHEYYRSDLEVASWTYFEDLWRHNRGQYWSIRGQLVESHEPAAGLWKFKKRSRVKRHHNIISSNSLTIFNWPMTSQWRQTRSQPMEWHWRGRCHEKDTWSIKMKRISMNNIVSISE